MAWELEERIATSESREVRGRAPLIQHSSKRSWEPVSEVCVLLLHYQRGSPADRRRDCPGSAECVYGGELTLPARSAVPPARSLGRR